jgi:hypothetical protein
VNTGGRARKACSLLLHAVGREQADVVSVRNHAAANGAFTVNSRIDVAGRRNQSRRLGNEELAEKSVRNGAQLGFFAIPQGAAWRVLLFGSGMKTKKTAVTAIGVKLPSPVKNMKIQA